MLVESIKRSIWRFTFFASVMFVQCSHQELFGKNKLTAFGARNLASAGETSDGRNKRAAGDYEYLPNGQTPIELLSVTDGFLAGEDTPVWRVHKYQGKSIYIKLADGHVKEAIDWWESTQSNRGYGNFSCLRTPPNPQVRYPSILAVLDYDDPYPKEPKKQHIWLYKGILYALAFWNGVDLQLRSINFPSVRIRLAGIVLCRTRDTVPYIFQNEHDGLDAESAIVPMMAYWKSLGINNPDFNTDAFDTVVTMTQAYRRGEQGIDWSASTAADSRPSCLGSLKGINGIIVHDNMDFRGIQSAVHSIARTLGAKIGGPCNTKGTVMEVSNETRSGSYGRKWSACTLEEISKNLLEYGSCMQAPKEYHLPGKPVKAILPGMLMSRKNICQVYVGPKKTPFDCFASMTDSPCDQLFCTSNTWQYNPCRATGTLVIDGSKCDGGFTAAGKKICLDGKCVKKPVI